MPTTQAPVGITYLLAEKLLNACEASPEATATLMRELVGRTVELVRNRSREVVVCRYIGDREEIEPAYQALESGWIHEDSRIAPETGVPYVVSNIQYQHDTILDGPNQVLTEVITLAPPSVTTAFEELEKPMPLSEIFRKQSLPQ